MSLICVLYDVWLQPLKQAHTKAKYKSKQKKNNPKKRGYKGLEDFTLLDHALCGVAAGWTSTLAATPVEQIKARLQVQYADPNTKIYKGPIHCGITLIKNNGITGLYKGMTGSLLFRAFISVYFTGYVLWKKFFYKHFENQVYSYFFTFCFCLIFFFCVFFVFVFLFYFFFGNLKFLLADTKKKTMCVC